MAASPRGKLRMLGILLLTGSAFLPGCFERKQAAILNPDGSGKMLIETTVAVPAQGVGKDKPTALSFGRQVAANLINNTHGVDAWADVAVAEIPGGRAKIVGTAYFPDLNKLKFDMPLEFVWKRDLDGATLAVQRTRTSVRNAVTTDAQLKEIVATAQSQYKDQQLALRTQLNAFRLDMSFELPGELADASLFTLDGNKVSIALDGKKAADALDKFMADKDALAATFKAGSDLPANDDILLQSMYGKNGPVSVRTKLAVDAKPVFDYKTDSRAAQFNQAAMLKAAGVELIPQFIVTDPATKPAATRGK